jgi:hypothetical protein
MSRRAGFFTSSRTSGLSFVLIPGSWTSIRLLPIARIRGSVTPIELMRALMISIAFVSFSRRAVSSS